MRISDWSSDVCSSDLLAERPHGKSLESRQHPNARPVPHIFQYSQIAPHCGLINHKAGRGYTVQIKMRKGSGIARFCFHCLSFRSEEHTSELQSLMRISYAVFCLKKNTKQTI